MTGRQMSSEKAVPCHITSILASRLILFFILIFLYISLVTHQTELTALTLFVLILTGFSHLWARSAFSHLAVDFCLDKNRVFAGETVTVTVTVRNNKFLPVWVRVGMQFDEPLSVHDHSPGRAAFFFWFEESSFQWKIQAKKRGYFNLGQSTVTVSDPLGFFPRQRCADSRIDLIVFPSLFPVRSVNATERHFFGSPGARSPVHDPVYILGTRQYQKSTPAKMIHWNASARLGSLQEKICEPSVQGKLLVMVDVDGFKDREAGDDFEGMLATAASLVNHFERKDHAVGFLTNGAVIGLDSGFVPLGRSRDTVSKILEMIARMGNGPQSAIHESFDHYAGFLRGIQVILCCRSPENVSEELNDRLSGRRISTVTIVVRDDPGRTVPERPSSNLYTMESVGL